MEPSTICVFCAAKAGNDPQFVSTAQRLGVALGRAGHRVVYGGGRSGLMGVVADAALAAGAEVVGVMPDAMLDDDCDTQVAELNPTGRAGESPREGLDRLVTTNGMHERKATMMRLADGFICLPGGFGTLDEATEVLTWNQIGQLDAPIVFLDVNGYWKPLFAFFEQATKTGLLAQRHRHLAHYCEDVEQAIATACGTVGNTQPG